MRKKRNQTAHKGDSSTFWDAIHHIRVAQGLTQEQLAEGVREKADAPWISRVESGKKDISLRTAIRIAQALGVDMFLDNYRLESDE